ncbi:hypothetical protein B9Z19DRAFT_376339 [Tuber borchii]|uniref:Uncharacterized protein n=1 Tax=Tuber borchii TaxID=42251 RepID=A0A2T6ZHN2_TUBBO|nr:hypothetical protein B9Z19DRAFT_376339 [Tuber borchii]
MQKWEEGERKRKKSNDTGKEGSSEICIEQIYGIIHLSVHIHVSAPPLPFIPVVPSLSFFPRPLGTVGFLPIIIITASCGGVIRKNVVFSKGENKRLRRKSAAASYHIRITTCPPPPKNSVPGMRESLRLVRHTLAP